MLTRILIIVILSLLTNNIMLPSAVAVNGQGLKAFAEINFTDAREIVGEKMRRNPRIKLSPTIEFFSSYTSENAPADFWVNYKTVVEINRFVYDFKCIFYNNQLSNIEISSGNFSAAQYQQELQRRWQSLTNFASKHYALKFQTHTTKYPNIKRLKAGINYTNCWLIDNKKEVKIGILKPEGEEVYSIIMFINYLPLEKQMQKSLQN
jgi:hypothetical protein